MSAIHQGVTLEVVGNCGFGCFPIRDRELARKAIYGYSDDGADRLDAAPAGTSTASQAARPAVNVLSLVPNGQLRLSTVGLADRPADTAELARHGATCSRESLGEGAWGYSTGLEYAQEAGATEEEITGALPRARPPAAALRDAHAPPRRGRDRVGRGGDPRRDARAASGCRSRTSCRGTGSRSRAARSSSSSAARDRGLDVEFDMHTRLYGLTHLYAALPPWALAEEPAALAELLRDPAARDRMRPHRSLLSAGNDWARIVLLDNPFWPEYARRDLASIAAERGQDAARHRLRPARAGALEAPHKLMVIIHAYTEDEQREAFAHPLCVPGSDATTLAPDGPLGRHLVPRRVHVGVVVLPLHGARRAAALPGAGRAQADAASRPRGSASRTAACSRPGARADVTVFDPARFAERGTTFEPNQLADGVATSSSTACTRCATAS